jgi:hypothetical protein
MDISEDRLTEWAETCLRINHLNTIVQWEIKGANLERASKLAERARTRAWNLFNEMIQVGARKPPNYREPDDPDEENSK